MNIQSKKKDKVSNFHQTEIGRNLVSKDSMFVMECSVSLSNPIQILELLNREENSKEDLIHPDISGAYI